MLRIFQTYAIAKNWNLGFAYDKLSSVYTQVFKHSDETELWNIFLESVLPPPQEKRVLGEFDRVISHKRHHPTLLLGQIRSLDFLKFHSLHIIDSPQVIINRFPTYLDCLQTLDGISHFRLPDNSDRLKIAIHIRQGELSLSQFRSRFLPLSYFEAVLDSIISLLTEECVAFDVQLFLEPNQDKLLDADDPLVKHSLSIDMHNPNLLRVSENQFRIFHEIPSSIRTPHLYGANLSDSQSAYETFLGLLSADIVVTSKSSFSYLAGLLNSNSIVVYPTNWDPPLSTWISTENLVDFRYNMQRRIQARFLN